ncbi:MAG: TIGR03546 family protein [Gammaproteobacteria bacterium]|nr:TIGR03546 family protein [Gammaproteobacteria bacterium]
MITQIIKFLRVLASEAAPIQISMGIALAMIIGFTPLLSLHNVLVVFVLLVFRINIAAFLLAWALFSGLAYLLDPVFHQIGLSLLQNESLQATWTAMYNLMFWRLANFNNTILMGSLVVSLLAFFPLVLILNVLIKQYRSHVLVFLNNSKIIRYLQNSKLVTRLTSMAES